MDSLVVASIIERVGAYIGFLALVGLAILALLYFSQARDVRRLREWAGRAPERAAEAEQRAAQILAPAQQQTVVRKPIPAQTVAGSTTTAQAGAGSGTSPATAAGRAAVGDATQVEPHEADEIQVAELNDQEVVPQDAELGHEQVEQGELAASAAEGGNAHSVTDQPTVAQAPVQPLTGEHYLPGTPYRDATPRQRKPLRQRARNIYIPQFRYIAAAIAVVVLLVLGVGSVTGLIDLGGGGGGSDKQSQKGVSGQRQSHGQAANVDPSQVTVAVLNGTTVTGLAYRVSQEAKSSGFTLGNVTNAATTDQPKSEVLYAPGQKSAARAVADRLGISTIAPVDSVNAEIAGSADAIVLVGADRS